MRLLLRICMVCFFSLVFVGCGDYGLVQFEQRQATGKSGTGGHEEALKAILDYIDQYERVYLQAEGPETLKRLSEVTEEYHKRMAKLSEEGKWTPVQEMGKSITLSFLIGQYQGGLRSCKVERAHKDKTLAGCDQMKKLRNAIEQLCSE
jgi:hypothetical protein